MYYDLDKIPIETNILGIDSRVLVDHAHATIKQLMLPPTGSIPVHQVPVEVTFFVLEGEGDITIGEQTYPVCAHSIVLCPANVNMAITAKQQGLSFLNIKTPGFKPVR